jgi:hypothetical protein
MLEGRVYNALQVIAMVSHVIKERVAHVKI